jgi:DNA-binding LytR/AlgR family response regulator
MYRVLIADDEVPAQNKMARMLQELGDYEIVNTSHNGIEALQNIINLKPDIAFLDIEMPGMTGLEVVQQLPEDNQTHIIFATAYNEHAIKAFELNAADYLLKPISKERLQQAMDRIAKYEKPKALAEIQKQAAMAQDPNTTAHLTKIPVPTADRFKLLDYSEVYCIEVDERTTYVHTNEKSYVVNLTLEHFEKKLPPSQFLRVSRSAIVNLEAVKELIIWFSNRYKIIMKNGKEIISSREKSKMLREILKF